MRIDLLALFLGSLYAAGAQAGAVEVEGGRCAEVIHIRAQDAPLSEVLAKASAAIGFRLDAKVDLTEKVTLDRKGPPDRLLKNLLQDRNLVIQTDPSKACGGKDRISTVWVLPAGQAVPRTAAAPVPAAAPPASGEASAPVRRHERPRGTRRSMTEEQWQQMKEDYKAGKVKADPETGKPVPATPDEQPKTPPESE